MGIMDYLTGPKGQNAIGALGQTLMALDSGQAPNLQPFYAQRAQIDRQDKMRGLGDLILSKDIGLTPQQKGILGPAIETMPEVGMGYLMQKAFPAPSDPYARYKNVGGALWDVGGTNGPTQLSKPEVGGSRYYTVSTSQGYMLVDKHTGESRPLGNSPAGVPSASPTASPTASPYKAPTADPTLQGEITAAREGAKSDLERAEVAPQKIANAETSLALIDQALQHPGFDENYGLMGMVPNRPGSESANAGALLEQLRGKAFLQAFETLKGGGQITEREGIAAQNAYARLQSSQSPAAARRALTEMRTAIAEGIRKLKQSGGAPAGASGQIKPLSEMSLEELQAKRREMAGQ